MWKRLIFVCHPFRFSPTVIGTWRCMLFLLSSVRLLWVMATSLWCLTGAVKMVRHSAQSNYKSLGIQPICERQYGTFATASLRAVSTQWVRALALVFFCPTWESAAPPAMWLLLPACRPSSAVRAGLRVVLPGPSIGFSCSIRRSALAGIVKWNTSNTLFHCIINSLLTLF